MSVQPKQTTQQKYHLDNTLGRPRKNKSARVVLIAAVTLCIVIIGLNIFGSYQDKNSMVQYLEEKYAQEFAVKDTRGGGGTIGARGYLEATAYPKSDKSIEFWVRKSRNTIINQEYFTDNYPGKFWQEEDKTVVEQMLISVFGKLPEYNVDIMTSGTNRGRNIKSPLPTFADATQRYGKSIAYNLIVKLSEPEVLLDLNELRLVKLLEYLNGLGINSSLSYQLQTNSDSYIVNIFNEEIVELSNNPDTVRPFVEKKLRVK